MEIGNRRDIVLPADAPRRMKKDDSVNLEEHFEAVDRAMVEAWIADEAQETLQLDFKRASAVLSGADHKTFAKALSGFANSAGGLVVWGVDARKNAAGVDCASALRWKSSR